MIRVIGGAVILLAMTGPSFELTIRWNQIRGVNSLDSVGQLVPFMLSLGQLIHIHSGQIQWCKVNLILCHCHPRQNIVR